MKKLSIIRGDTVAQCPYGLPVISACKNVGDTILTMVPIDESDKLEHVTKNNLVTYHTQKLDERCPFANEIMDKFNKVDCSWGDTAAGDGVHYLPASPLYPRTFIGDGFEPGFNKGQDIYDPRLYFDAPERDIDVPFGLYSIFSSRSNELSIIRIAEKYTNKIPYSIRDKISFLRDKYYNVLTDLMKNKPPKSLDEKELTYLLDIIGQW